MQLTCSSVTLTLPEFFNTIFLLKISSMWLPVDIMVKYVTICHTESVPFAMVIVFSSLNQVHVCAQHENNHAQLEVLMLY